MGTEVAWKCKLSIFAVVDTNDNTHVDIIYNLQVALNGVVGWHGETTIGNNICEKCRETASDTCACKTKKHSRKNDKNRTKTLQTNNN